jgi:hypothetical protein
MPCVFDDSRTPDTDFLAQHDYTRIMLFLDLTLVRQKVQVLLRQMR